jgi:hypothetical protein
MSFHQAVRKMSAKEYTYYTMNSKNTCYVQFQGRNGRVESFTELRPPLNPQAF